MFVEKTLTIPVVSSYDQPVTLTAMVDEDAGLCYHKRIDGYVWNDLQLYSITHLPSLRKLAGAFTPEHAEKIIEMLPSIRNWNVSGEQITAEDVDLAYWGQVREIEEEAWKVTKPASLPLT